MNMIGHQHIGVYRHMVFIRSQLDTLQIKPVILFREKARFAIVAPLRYVVGVTTQVHSWLPCHEVFLIVGSEGQSKFTLTPFQLVFIRSQLDALQIKSVILFREKACFPIVSALRYVIGVSTQIHSWLPCHKVFLT
jgi:hypothetical protein